jgi:hypothetical protein
MKGKTMKTYAILIAALIMGMLASARAADVTGKWKAEFDTQIGHLKYTYDLKADGEKVTGKAFRDQEGQKSETEITEGKLSGDDISFVEPLKFAETTLRIEYKGKVKGDELKLTRKVGDYGTTDIVAKREAAEKGATEKTPGK